MDLVQDNAIAARIARNWLRVDLAMRYANGVFGSPFWCNRFGALLLRRWAGKLHPIPDLPACVGFVKRPATQVSAFAGATYANDNVYWHRVDTVSGGGVVTIGPPDQAQPAVWGASGYAGAVPNTPLHPRLVQIAGPKLVLTWAYNPLGEQATPAAFDIFSDGGGGSIDWNTPVGSIDYVDGQRWYQWTSGTLGSGRRLYNVRARSAAAVYSLVPDVADGFIGGSDDYIPAGGSLGLNATVTTATPADAAAPLFA